MLAFDEAGVADMSAGFHQLVRAGRIAERKAGVNHRLQPLRVEQRPYLLAQRRCDPSLVGRRLRSQSECLPFERTSAAAARPDDATGRLDDRLPLGLLWCVR